MQQEITYDLDYLAIETAFALSAKWGYEFVTLSDVAKAGGIADADLRARFESRTGLFKAMVRANAQATKDALFHPDADFKGRLSKLEAIGAVTVEMALGDRAMTLYRAASADRTGELGRAIVDFGRDEVMPSLLALVESAIEDGEISGHASRVVEIFLTLLIRDSQMRRITGAMAAPDKWFCASRATQAVGKLKRLYPANP